MDWEFHREETVVGLIPEGPHRIRINKVEKKVSAKGHQMLSFVFDVSGTNLKLFYNLVFLKEHPEITNRNLTSFFDSFLMIPEGDFNIQNWVGKIGACNVRHEEYRGDKVARVNYFIKAQVAETLPPWKETGVNPSATTSSTSEPNFMPIDDIDLPFN